MFASAGRRCGFPLMVEALHGLPEYVHVLVDLAPVSGVGRVISLGGIGFGRLTRHLDCHFVDQEMPIVFRLAADEFGELPLGRLGSQIGLVDDFPQVGEFRRE